MVETLRQAIEHWLHQYGPEPGPPPGSIVDALVALHREELPDATAEALSERAEEIVVAFGAGWRREALGEEGWEGRWRPALDWVTRRVHGWVLDAAKWLYGIPLQGFAYTVPFSLWEAKAWEIAYDLWQGTCGCWRVFYPEAELEHKRDVRRAQERAGRCGRTHHLAAWNPHEMSLSNFIARAVKGDKRTGQQRGKKGFVSAAFSYSMFFRHLYEDHNVWCGNVLSWCCPHHTHIPFEGPQCLECKDRRDRTVFDEARHRRRVQKMRLLVAAPTGRYEPTRFWRCQKKTCQNYYPHDFPVCPVCQHRRTRGAASSIVWVLGPRRITRRDQDGRREERDLRASASLTGTLRGADAGCDRDEAVRDAVKRLPPDLREIIDMRLADKTEEEIADGLQRPQKEIRAAIRKASAQLRTLLEPDFGHTDD